MLASAASSGSGVTEGLSSAPSSATVTTELAMRRTGMAFQRTRMAADRTLMAVIRTALSLISFGFTIYTFFNKLRETGVLKGAAAARNFGESLVLLGIGMLILGIIYHSMYMLGLRRMRTSMKVEGLVHAESGFPASLVLIVAVILLLIGVGAAFSMIGHVGPFGE
jgi:putative membrane protein